MASCVDFDLTQLPLPAIQLLSALIIPCCGKPFDSWVCGSMIEHLPSMLEALSSVLMPSTTKNIPLFSSGTEFSIEP